MLPRYMTLLPIYVTFSCRYMAPLHITPRYAATTLYAAMLRQRRYLSSFDTLDVYVYERRFISAIISRYDICWLPQRCCACLSLFDIAGATAAAADGALLMPRSPRCCRTEPPASMHEAATPGTRRIRYLPCHDAARRHYDMLMPLLPAIC